MGKATGIASAAVAVMYISAAGFLPLTALDRMVLPDDTYYTLSIARNIARGLGPTIDGVVQTSGFQPLIAVIMQPVFWIGLDGDAALRAVVMLSAVFGALACLLTGRIVATATASDTAGALAVLLAGTSSLLLANALNGLETTLAAAIVLWLVALAMGTTAGARPLRLVGVGAVAGLAIWARIDTAFAILILGAVAMVRIGPARTGIVALTAFAVALPWMMICMRIGGAPIPESGSAVRQILEFHFEIGAEPALILGHALMMLPEAILPRAIVGQVPVIGLFGLHLLLLLPLWQARRAGRMDAPAVLALLAVVMLAFYIFYLPAFWFFHRYLHLAGLAFLVAVLVGVSRIGGPRAVVALGLLLIAGQAIQSGREIVAASNIPDHPRQGYGYADAAAALLPLLPADATLGAMQSGALTWHAPDNMRVVNLDGVVNGDAKAAIHDYRLDGYLNEIGATHFADWPLNTAWLQARSEGELRLVPIGALADHNGPGQDFTLYRIDR